MKNTTKLAVQMTILRSRFPVGRPAQQPRRQRQLGAWLWLMSIMLLVAGGLVLVSPSLAALVNIKLSGPLANEGDVWNFQVSPDGSRVVYRADQDTDDVDELYSVPLAGGSPVKLNSPLVSGGDVSFFRISPDSSRVVYQADQDTDDVWELYSVPLDGGSPVKLNGSLVSGGDIPDLDFQVSPDSSRVVYRADQDTDGVWELYSVPLAGGSPVKLNGSLVSGGDVWSFQVSPDSSRVVYNADQNTDDVDELYSVPLAGGSPVKLNGSLVSGGGVWSFQVSPDSSRVVYRAEQDTVGVLELYVSYDDGTAPPEHRTYLPVVLKNYQ
jgi:dipeptidyl aminopeptidase/acylaminoacyl peptidase